MQRITNLSLLNFTPDEIRRFSDKIKTGLPDECWEWQAAINSCGYGNWGVSRDGRLVQLRPHRVAYFFATAKDPGEMLVCHKCDNRRCCNPNHFFLGTGQDNSNDMKQKGRQAMGARHGSKLKPDSVPRGDRTGPRKYPERYPKGDIHYARTNPERLARGDRSGARLHPERMARGDKHYARLHPEKLARGEKAGNAILTTEQVQEIRRIFSQPIPSLTQKRAAIIYGVSKATINHILKRRIWKHL